ncbi:MAG: alpha/beta fold hydrolase [Pseudomonadota bacterium]
MSASNALKSGKENISFSASDGYELQGTIYRPPEGIDTKIAILLTSGTGFPQFYYQRIASYLASLGAIVLTFDCRGIGRSRPDDLATLKMDYPDWGQLDMPAALAALCARAGPIRTVHLGHSVGGHFAGFMANHDLIDAHAFICVGSGYWRDHPIYFNAFELLFWYVMGPVGLWRKGYVPHGNGWSGTDLPRGVFDTWKRWCTKPNYYQSELDAGRYEHHFDQVTAPIRSWVFSDDPIANEKTSQVILNAYRNAPTSIIYRKPSDYGVPKVGHAGAFRAGFETLWNEWFDWLQIENSDQT